MIPKVECCVRAIAQGVRTASIIDGRVPRSLLLEILTPVVTNALLTAYARSRSRAPTSPGIRASAVRRTRSP